MTPDWKADLMGREPSAEDAAAVQRNIELQTRVQFYMQAATKWCFEAGEWNEKYTRARREARGAEIVAGLLAVALLYVLLRGRP